MEVPRQNPPSPQGSRGALLPVHGLAWWEQQHPMRHRKPRLCARAAAALTSPGVVPLQRVPLPDFFPSESPASLSFREHLLSVLEGISKRLQGSALRLRGPGVVGGLGSELHSLVNLATL